jgi:hypothetical protein
MYVISGHERGYFGTQAGHVTRLVDQVENRPSRPRSMKVLYKATSTTIRDIT